jgi:ribosome biogenesis protein Nip4
MRDFKNFRLLHEREAKIIFDSLIKISPKISIYLQEGLYNLIISDIKEDRKKMVYQISNNIGKVISGFLRGISIDSAGMFLGFISRHSFFLSLEGAEFFLKEKLIPDHQTLIVNKKGEKAILYGNPILKKMISDKIASDIQKNEILLVLNEYGELIALARSEIEFSRLKAVKQGQLVAKNLIDKGYYLRRKQ